MARDQHRIRRLEVNGRGNGPFRVVVSYTCTVFTSGPTTDYNSSTAGDWISNAVALYDPIGCSINEDGIVIPGNVLFAHFTVLAGCILATAPPTGEMYILGPSPVGFITAPVYVPAVGVPLGEGFATQDVCWNGPWKSTGGICNGGLLDLRTVLGTEFTVAQISVFAALLMLPGIPCS
jgi:hypothetical protein